MKFTTSALLGAAAPLAAAFPAAVMEAVQNNPELVARVAELTARQSGANSAQAIFEPVNTFNAKAQFIDLSNNPWQAPGPDDLRGPCPGLNAMANHGYLPRNGYATSAQLIQATTEVVGMGLNLATFLVVLGDALDGDLTSWSIGGTPPAGVGGALAHYGNGLSGSHNKYETDASPTRPDLYQAVPGDNNYDLVLSQYQDMINYCPGNSVDIDCLTSFRSHRFDQQIAVNPYFFNGPFSGVAVQPAAYTFIFRFMANHSETAPAGELNYDVLKSWFGVTGENGDYSVNQGYERIPENWYRRALEYPYDTDYYLADVVAAALLHPKFLSIGGNTGTTNSFTGVDLENLTGGLFNLDTLLKGNNLGCFVFQAATQANSDLVSGLLSQVTSTLSSALSPILGALECPQLQAIDNAELEQFPGYKKSGVTYN